MKSKWLMMSLLSLCTALALSACTVTADNRSVAETIEQSLNTMVNEPVLPVSSNPNDYIAGNRVVLNCWGKTIQCKSGTVVKTG